jgi:hypothetical protein
MTKLFGVLPSSEVINSPILEGVSASFNLTGKVRLSTVIKSLNQNSDSLSRYDDLYEIFRDHLEVVQVVESSSEQEA